MCYNYLDYCALLGVIGTRSPTGDPAQGKGIGMNSIMGHTGLFCHSEEIKVSGKGGDLVDLKRG